MSYRMMGAAAWAALAVSVAVAQEAPKKVVPWSAMAQVNETSGSTGKSITYAKAIDALDGKVIAVKGFRIPLEVKTHFLVAAKPSDCETCIEGGPGSYVEVFSTKPVQATFGKPLTVAGRLELMRSNPTGSYYRLMDATVVSVD